LVLERNLLLPFKRIVAGAFFCVALAGA